MYYVRTLVNPSVVRLKSNKCIDMFFAALLPNVPTAKEVSNEGKKNQTYCIIYLVSNDHELVSRCSWYSSL